MATYVGSRSNATVVVRVEMPRGEAIQFARARFRIGDPIALTDDHGTAVWLRQQFLAQFWPKMPDLNGHSPMCFDNRHEAYQFD